MIDFHQLQSFVEVARAGSVGAAAKTLHRSQPAISRSVRLLEEDLGTPLFVRQARGMSLTPAGVTLLKAATGILDEVERARMEVTRIAGEPCGTCSIGASHTFGTMIFGEIAARLAQRFPRVRLRLVEGDIHDLVPRLVARTLDMAVLIDPTDHAELVSRRLFDEQVFLVGLESDPGFDLSDPITMEELSAFPLAAFPREQGRRVIIDEAARRAGVRLDIRYEMETMRTIIEFARRGLCMGLITRSGMMASEVGGLAARPVAGLTFERRLHMHRAAEEDPLRETVTAMVLDVIGEMVCDGELAVPYPHRTEGVTRLDARGRRNVPSPHGARL